MKRGTRRAARLLLTFTAAVTAVLTMAAPGVAVVPPVDPYQAYVDPGCMSFVEQPGVRTFRDMIMSRVGGTSGGIHACSGYEHGEGRAWDWMRNASEPAQAQQVQLVLDWLLATDAAGNPHAMARRLGIGNIIWNRRSISLWTSSAKVWNNYPCNGTPGSCHTNHVHFAFSWAGARQQTSWFTTADRPGNWYPGGVVSLTSLPANRSFGTATDQHYFDRGPDGSLRHWYWTPATGVVTQNWGGSLAGKPVAYPYSDGSQHVFARGADGRLKHWYWQPGMGSTIGLQDWGGDAAGDPAGFTDGVNQHAFARGSDGKLKHWYWVPGMGSTIGYQDWGGSLVGQPLAYQYTDGSQHVFARGTDGRLKHWYWTPSTGVTTQDWGGDAAGDPAGFSDGVNQHAFARGSDGKLKHWYWVPGMGSTIGYQDWGGNLTGVPVAYPYPGGSQHVFARGTDGKLKHWYWQPAMGSTIGLQDWGGDAAADPAGFTDGTNQHAFARGSDGKLKHWYWVPGMSSTNGYEDWGGQIA